MKLKKNKLSEIIKETLGETLWQTLWRIIKRKKKFRQTKEKKKILAKSRKK